MLTCDLFALAKFHVWMCFMSSVTDEICHSLCLTTYTPPHTTVLRPFLRDHPGEPVPEGNFWTLWCKGRLTEADTLTIRLGATPSEPTSAHLHHPPFFTGQMPFLPPNQQCQSSEGNLEDSQCMKKWPGELTLHLSSSMKQYMLTCTTRLLHSITGDWVTIFH